MERTSEARWDGELKSGKGHLKLGSGAFEGAYSFSTRFETGAGTNPEELLGAAHAACYSMALAAGLGRAGHAVKSVHTTAAVKLENTGGGFGITGIHLTTRGDVPGLSEADFQKAAEDTKVGCIVSKALAAVPMTLDARLVSSGA